MPPQLFSAPVRTPLKLHAWQAAHSQHPNKQWAQAILKGIREGFRIGLNPSPQYRSTVLTAQPNPKNAPSAASHQQVVQAFIQDQVDNGYMLGPFSQVESPNILVSRLGAIPKKAAGKWRVIVDLSSPSGYSVNDNLRRNLTHVAYASVEDAAVLMHILGRDTLMAKIDIRSAYRMVPIHPEDRWSLGVIWDKAVYVDCQLPFGLASAPAIFNAMADALEWILRSRGIRAIIHYLDDFLVLGAPASDKCQRALELTIRTCDELGVPLAMDKVEGPCNILTFLGIELNSTAMSLALRLTNC